MIMFELLQQRWRAEQAAMVERAACRRQAITGALSMLARYQVHRAYLFGSVQRGECREGADIDLYVEPLPVAKYWQLLHELEEATDLDIDLHAPGDDAAFIATIKDRGELIYESIARFFENDLRAGSWHRDLLKRRSRGSGPRVIDDELHATLDDFRGFRHRFRHGYSFELDWQRERLVAAKLVDAHAALASQVTHFLARLDALDG